MKRLHFYVCINTCVCECFYCTYFIFRKELYKLDFAFCFSKWTHRWNSACITEVTAKYEDYFDGNKGGADCMALNFLFISVFLCEACLYQCFQKWAITPLLWALERIKGATKEKETVGVGDRKRSSGGSKGALWGKQSSRCGVVMPSFESPKGLKMAGTSKASVGYFY